MPTHPLRWWGLVVVLCGVLVDLLDNQIVAVALPTIHEQLGGGEAALQWISAGYALGFALTLITGGRLGDRYGVKKLFLAGMSIFTAASLLAGLAPNTGVLIAARVVQGIGAGLMSPQVLSFVFVEFPEQERARATAWFTAVYPVGNTAGPLLGGVITQADLFGTGWRAIFLVNVPIGILALIGAVWSMPSRPGWIRHKLDSRGLVLLTGALFALFYPLVQGRELGWPLWSIILMVASVPLFGAFFWQQAAQSRSGGEPLIPPSLLRYKTLLTALAILFTLTAALGVFFVINMHLQLGLGFSPLQTVLVFLPSAVGSIIGNFGAVKLAAKIGRAFIATAVAGVLVSMVSMAILVVVLGNSLGPWSLSVSTLVFGLGIGAMMNSLFTLAMGDIEPQDAGAVSGVVGTTLQLGSASGIALFGTIFFAGFASGGTVSATVTSLVVSIVVLLVTLAVSARLPRSRAAREAVAAAG